MNYLNSLHSLIALHAAIGGVWSIEIRNGQGFNKEIILSARSVEDCDRLATDLGIKLGRQTSVSGDSWWSDGETTVDGITVRVTGPHFRCECEGAQP